MSDLFLKLLNMSITASWLILAVVVLRLVLKKAPKWVNCVLWALVAVRLICPFSFESNLSLVPDVELAEMPMSQTAAGADIEIDETTGKIEFMESLPVYDPTIETGNNTGNMRNDSVPQTSGQKWAVVDIVAAAWLAGMVILLLYAAISYLRLRRKVSAAMPLRENIWLCDGVKSPFILGILRPRIYLPSAISEENMEHVLAHERAHLQRRDHWWKPVGFVLLAVYWFNPLVWAAYILLCRDIELACDEKVIKSPNIDRKGYSEALLNCSVKRTAITACPLAFGEVSVRGRIKSVLNYKKPAFWIIIAALVACIVLAICFLTDPVKKVPTQDDVTNQNGYGITEIVLGNTLGVKIPTNVLPEDLDAYTIQNPYVYEKGEVVLWQTGTTTLWLESVGCEEGKNDVVFDCEFSYEILDAGTLRTISYPEIQDGITVSSHVVNGIGSRDVSDSNTVYPDAAYLRGSNWGRQLCIGVDADVVREAQDYIAFDLTLLVDITYEKGEANHEDKIPILTAEEYRQYIQEKYDIYAAAERNNVDPEELTDAIIEGLQTGFFSPFSELEIVDRAVSAIGKANDLSNITVVAELEDIGIGKEGKHANVELAKEIATQFGTVSSDYTAYYHNAIEAAIGFYEYNLVRKQLNLSYGDKVPTYFLSPDQTTLVAVKQDKEGTNYAWTFVKKAAEEWVLIDSRTEPSDQFASAIGGVDGPENITVTAEDASIGVAMIDAVEELLAGKLPATICKMDETGHVHPVFGKLNAWDSINGKNSCRAILDHTYQEVDSLETSDALITLEFTVDGVDWGLTFYDGTDSLSVWTGGAEYYFKAIPNYEDIFLSPLGSLIRRWYDEAEYMAMDGYDGKTIVIPNTGQSYLEAAQAWCEAYESLHLMASSGSKECYSYVSCRVVPAEGATSMYREQGEIGENTYAFRVHTAFVPENEQALQWHMAGNTGDYEGNDPNVPQEALEYMQCGYITLEEDGWHGTIVGTGF